MIGRKQELDLLEKNVYVSFFQFLIMYVAAASEKRQFCKICPDP